MKKFLVLFLVALFLASFVVTVWAAPYRTKYACHIVDNPDGSQSCVKGYGARHCDSCWEADK